MYVMYNYIITLYLHNVMYNVHTCTCSCSTSPSSQALPLAIILTFELTRSKFLCECKVKGQKHNASIRKGREPGNEATVNVQPL